MSCRARVTIEFLDFWHSGNGEGRDVVADAAVYRDDNGLPALGEGTVKGLLRDAVRELEGLGRAPLEAPAGTSWTVLLFGGRGVISGPAGMAAQPPEGRLGFTAATLSGADREWVLRQAPAFRKRVTAQFFRDLSSTALKDGVARDRTLRTVEVGIPCRLEATISGPAGTTPEPDWYRVIRESLPLLRSAGRQRHRGLGRCRVEIHEVEDLPEPPEIDPAAVPEAGSAWIRITLLSPAILPTEARTEGVLGGHDHLPGSVLWGAAIRAMKAAGASFCPSRFMRDVSFSPGYPLSREGRWAVPIPLTWYRLKTDVSGTVHNWLKADDSSGDERDDGKPVQVRSGFVVPEAKPLQLVRSDRRARLKTAIDEDGHDRPAPAQLYGFGTLAAGSTFAARIAGEPKTVEEAVAALTSRDIRLGRARSPGFGQVRIERLDEPPVQFGSADQPGRTVLYLLSDLALYRDGIPTLQPCGADFSPILAGWKWCPQESSVRVRSYAPWNAFHGGFDYQRQVLTRGSVLVFRPGPGPGPRELTADELSRLRAGLESGVGSHRAEGCGRVLLNPAFVLDSEPGVPAGPKSDPTTAPDPRTATPPPPAATPLTHWLARAAESDCETEAEGVARNWISDLETLLAQQRNRGHDLPGPSQWAALRGLAARHRTDRDALRQAIEEYCRQGAIRPDVWMKDLRLEKHPVQLATWLASLLDASEGAPAPAVAIRAFALVVHATHARAADRRKRERSA